LSAVEFPEIAARPFAVVQDAPADESGEEQHLAVVEVPPLADVVEWTPERAAAMVRAFGMGLHMFDPATNLPGGDDLWRATSTEAAEIGEPLSRILARYSPTRKLAGVVDEAEMGVAFVSYAKRNMRTRGRVVLAERDRGVSDFTTDADIVED
jgi:hypothetical protein